MPAAKALTNIGRTFLYLFAFEESCTKGQKNGGVVFCERVPRPLNWRQIAVLPQQETLNQSVVREGLCGNFCCFFSSVLNRIGASGVILIKQLL